MSYLTGVREGARVGGGVGWISHGVRDRVRAHTLSAPGFGRFQGA